MAHVGSRYSATQSSMLMLFCIQGRFGFARAKNRQVRGVMLKNGSAIRPLILELTLRGINRSTNWVVNYFLSFRDRQDIDKHFCVSKIVNFNQLTKIMNLRKSSAHLNQTSLTLVYY